MFYTLILIYHHLYCTPQPNVEKCRPTLFDIYFKHLTHGTREPKMNV